MAEIQGVRSAVKRPKTDVEAKLAPGERHGMTRSRYYLDEDTWIAALGDRWDMNGILARTLWALPLVLPDLPAVVAVTSGGHDLVKGTWIAIAVLNGKPLSTS